MFYSEARDDKNHPKSKYIFDVSEFVLEIDDIWNGNILQDYMRKCEVHSKYSNIIL